MHAGAWQWNSEGYRSFNPWSHFWANLNEKDPFLGRQASVEMDGSFFCLTLFCHSEFSSERTVVRICAFGYKRFISQWVISFSLCCPRHIFYLGAFTRRFFHLHILLLSDCIWDCVKEDSEQRPSVFFSLVLLLLWCRFHHALGFKLSRKDILCFKSYSKGLNLFSSESLVVYRYKDMR